MSKQEVSFEIYDQDGVLVRTMSQSSVPESVEKDVKDVVKEFLAKPGRENWTSKKVGGGKAKDDANDDGDEDGEPESYAELSPKDLKAECKARGLEVTGTKEEMVARLEADDAAKE